MGDSKRRDLLHDFLRSTDSAYWKAASKRFAENREVRHDAKRFLSPAKRKPVSGNHFVEDEQRARAACHLSHLLEVSGLGADAPAVDVDWFHNYRSHLVVED